MKYIIFSMLIVFPFLLQSQEMGRVEVLDANAFEVKIQHIKGALLDVRTPEEYSAGHLEGAKNIDWNAVGFKSEVIKFPLHEPVFVYCAGGFRSDEAASWLQKEGFRTIIVLKDGYDHWKETGKKVVIPVKEAKPVDK